MKPNIVWFDIPALDLDRAIRFYSAVLGALVTKETVDEVPLGWLPTADGGGWAVFVSQKIFDHPPTA